MTNIVLRDILFIPDLTKNLISTSQLVNLGCIISSIMQVPPYNTHNSHSH
jgi:hypothetical protein